MDDNFNLTTLTFEEGSKLWRIGILDYDSGRTFANCTSLVEFVVPDTITAIGEYAFENCSNLISIDIPDSVTSIEATAFNTNEIYGEEGIIYAIHSFFRKLAQGLGPSLGLVFMVALGYDETEEVDSIMDMAEKKVFDLTQKKNTKSFTPIKDVLVESFAELERLYRSIR